MQAEVEAVKPRYRGNRKTVITELPSSFTLSELAATLEKLKAKSKPTQLINVWISRRLISETAEGIFQKTTKFYRIYQSK